MKDGIMAMVWSGMRAANGFSGCVCVLSWTYSVTALSDMVGIWGSGDLETLLTVFGRGRSI